MMRTALVWLRRDLRLEDHAALHHATQRAARVIPVFIFDTAILDQLPQNDRRVGFIHASLQALQTQLVKYGSSLVVGHGSAVELIPRLAAEWSAEAVFCNRDYEPFARQRDAAVEAALARDGRTLHTFKDQVIFECREVVKPDGDPYRVFTPYKQAWLRRLADCTLPHFAIRYEHLIGLPPQKLPDLFTLGFSPAPLPETIHPGSAEAQSAWRQFHLRLADYAATRDYPALHGTSSLSVHLRFGTLSIRQLVTCAMQEASPGAQIWLSELIWREFYQHWLFLRPDLAEGCSFKPEMDHIAWPNPADHFAAWSEARTGYPLVDAAMRQLLATGLMHNRLRMVSASFLVKDLQVDWRLGEAWFARHLLDFDLAANNGGWQWCASTGCDAQPWFRIFNPVTQSQKFDPQAQFIREYLPELAGLPDRYVHTPWLSPLRTEYPAPIVDHAAARDRTLNLYRSHSAGSAAVAPTAPKNQTKSSKRRSPAD